MNYPTRPRFSGFRVPAWPTCLGVVAVVGLVVALGYVGTPPPSGSGGGGSVMSWVVIGALGAWAPAFFGLLKLDKRVYLNKQARALREFGFDLRRSDHDFEDDEQASSPFSLAIMKPVPLASSVERWGEMNDAARRTLVGVADVSVGKQEEPWVFVMVRVSLDVPPFAIGPTRSSKKRQTTNLLSVDHAAFSDHRGVFVSDEIDKSDADTLATFLGLTGDLFSVPKPPGVSFRLSELPGTNEQWAFTDGWLAYAEKGRAKAAPLIEAVEMVTRVAERLESEAPMKTDGAEKTASMETRFSE